MSLLFIQPIVAIPLIQTVSDHQVIREYTIKCSSNGSITMDEATARKSWRLASMMNGNPSLTEMNIPIVECNQDTLELAKLHMQENVREIEWNDMPLKTVFELENLSRYLGLSKLKDECIHWAFQLARERRYY